MIPTGTTIHATPTAHVAIVPAYELSETALKLSRVIEREANRRSALRASGLMRVEQNIPMFRRMSSRLRTSISRSSLRSKRSVPSVVAPTPEDAELDQSKLSSSLLRGPLQPIRSASQSLAPSPRASMKGIDSSFRTGDTSQASDGADLDEPLTLRGRVWQFFDDPQSSLPAYYFSVSLFFFITLSTVVFIAQTDRSLARHRATLNVLETVCAAVFTVEYSLRALSSPSKWHFAKNFGNLVDLAAILPFYLEAILAVENAGSFGAIRIVRLTRVARVLKMSRYSSAIQVFVQAIAISIKALSMLVFLMAIAVIVFSSAIYFAEYTPDGCRAGGWIGNCDGTNVVEYAGTIGTAASAGARAAAIKSGVCVCVDPNPYSSIAESFWWSIVTMSTVGYGDMTPVTVPGRIVGIATILTGMLVLALPITVIGTNFQKVMKSVMQQTMKSNVDYLKGKKQICREEIQAILQRFHAVTTDIHLNIDDIIQVYDTDNSGTLEDEELARFRHDLELLQNRAYMNQHMDMQATTPATLAISVPDSRGSPSKTIGALMRKLSSRSDIFQKPSPTPPSPSPMAPHHETTTRQTIAVPTQASPASPVASRGIRSSLSQPSKINEVTPAASANEPVEAIQLNHPGKKPPATNERVPGHDRAVKSPFSGAAAHPEKVEPVGSDNHHPLGVERDVLAEASALVLKRRDSGPSVEQLDGKDSPDNSEPSNVKKRDAALDDDDDSDDSTHEHRKKYHDHHHDHHKRHHGRDSLHHRSSRNGHHDDHHHHHHEEATEDLILQRLAQIQRTFEDRLLESEARLESKILNLTKILMRVEKLIELND